jgi:hypothetical protein
MCSTTGSSKPGTVQSPAELLDAVRQLSEADLGGLPDAVKLARTREMNQLRCAVDAAMTHHVDAVHTSGAGGYDGFVSTRSWMRHELRMPDAQAGSYLDAAVALPDLPEMAAEFTDGRVSLDHVGVLAWLRKKAGSEVAGYGDGLLTGYALQVGPRELRRLAKQVREHFQDDNDPDPRPEPSRYLRLDQTFDGVWALDGTLTPEAGAILRTALDAAMTRPAPDDDRTPAERRHDAFVELLTLALNSAKLPNKGGEPVHLGVLVPLADLRDARDKHADPSEPECHSPELAEEINAYLASLDTDPTPGNDDTPNDAAENDHTGTSTDPDDDTSEDPSSGADTKGTYGLWPAGWNGEIGLDDLINDLDLDLLSGGFDSDDLLSNDEPSPSDDPGRPWPVGWNGEVDLDDLMNSLDLDLDLDLDLSLLTGGFDFGDQASSVDPGDLSGDNDPCNGLDADLPTGTAATGGGEETGAPPDAGRDREPDTEPETGPGWAAPGLASAPHRSTGSVGLPDALTRQLFLPGLGNNHSRMPRPGQGARTDYGDYLSSDAARRLACDCALMRVILGPKDIPIRASQRVRLVPATLRRILVARDGGCRFPGCDRPAAYTEAHHIRHWADGGLTVLENMVLLCTFHHHRVHDDHWVLEFDGTILTVYRPDGTRLVVAGDTEPTSESVRADPHRQETAQRT